LFLFTQHYHIYDDPAAEGKLSCPYIGLSGLGLGLSGSGLTGTGGLTGEGLDGLGKAGSSELIAFGVVLMEGRGGIGLGGLGEKGYFRESELGVTGLGGSGSEFGGSLQLRNNGIEIRISNLSIASPFCYDFITDIQLQKSIKNMNCILHMVA
jgi:hypothetical protein